jgi:hypothetical protein
LPPSPGALISPYIFCPKKDIVIVFACLLHTALVSHLPYLCPKTIEKWPEKPML